MRKLDVYFNNNKAGELTEQVPDRDYTFSYDDNYLHSDGYSISATLPKRKEPYRSEHLFPFFSNLLPEGANRKVICRALRIDEKDLMGGCRQTSRKVMSMIGRAIPVEPTLNASVRK